MANHFDPEELLEVFSSFDPVQVQIARDLLDGGAIEAFVFDAHASGIIWGGALVPTRLMVHAADADEARSRLKELGFVE
jgi:hypothetical protein